ncbi:hypothetical protein GRI38_05945 [Altererythrobacter aurantiacus]|uniref:Sulfotransferase family protein n=1 Tax=Parapontixanthobacter aurantiacus TaxID=1463599 RepID=A0A844ZCR3_9SPHN|nr:hypothetical protein [Parapontixanthobacter aurantiacus]MXO85568.1 hypothetical protein [Parapontixanthobacter aurantiacus]
MPTSAEIAADPLWLPHKADFATRRMTFVRLRPERFAETAFLADQQPTEASDSASLSFDEVIALDFPTGPLHFIFHTAFCRSTLLVRALNIPGFSIGMSEPGIFASLAGAGQQAGPLLKPVLDLLSRPHPGRQAVFVKPSNHTNMLIPALMEARPDARAILMSNALPAFLEAVIRKGMMGRRWGRQLYLELQSYATLDLGMDGRETYLMTDLQAAGAAWLLNRRWFELNARNAVGRAGERMVSLDGDRFNEHKADTLIAALKLAGIDLPRERADAVGASPVFGEYSKGGSDFATKEADDRARSSSPVTREEMEQVGQWVGMVAKQSGIAMEVPSDLF